MRIFKLDVPDIVCSACAAPVGKALRGCKGVQSVTVNTVRKTATVTILETDNTSDTEIQEILCGALEDVGFPATTHKKRVSSKKIIRNYWIKGLVGVISGAAMMALCIWGMGIPLLAMYIIAGVSSLLTLYLGKETYQQAAIQLVKAKTLSMDFLFAVSTLIALGVSWARFFVPWLPMMFDAPLFILGFKNMGAAIKESAKRRATKMSFRKYAPKEIDMEESEESVEEDNDNILRRIKSALVTELVPGDIIIVRSGQTVPTNAICLSKNVRLYTTRISGRTVPQHIEPGKPIYAGSVVPKDIPFIRMKVTAKESDSHLAKLDHHAEQAELEKPPIEVSTDNMLRYFIRTVFAIAIISALVVGFFISPVAAIQCAVSVLAAACPCTLGLIIPLAIKAAIAKAMGYGIIFKSGNSVQTAAETNAAVLDYTGTLTTGIPKIIEANIPEEMLAHLAAIEKDIDHPVAKAILDYANSKKNNTEFKSVNCNKSFHAGVTATIDDKDFAVGNAKMMDRLGIDVSEYENDVKSKHAEHVIYFVSDQTIVGTILLKDPLRDDAKQTVRELKKRFGEKIFVRTGTNIDKAKFADDFGIPLNNIQTNCSSHDKKEFVESLSQAGHKVVMIGDGANDSPAMLASHFSIAVQSTTSDKIIQETAGASIDKSSLWGIIIAFMIADQAAANIKQSLIASILYNLFSMTAFGGLLVALGFVVNPGIGALLMVVQVGLILANLERFKQQDVPVLKPDPLEFTKGTHAQLSPRLAGKTRQPDLQPSPSGSLCNSFSRLPRLGLQKLRFISTYRPPHATSQIASTVFRPLHK